MNKSVVIVLGSIIIIGIVMSGYFIFSNDDDEVLLTIYTYDSLLAYPGFDYDRAFELFAGLPNGSVKVVQFDDSDGIIIQASVEKENPTVDVLIGIDNAQIHLARSKDILTPYKPKGVDLLIDGLVDGLASDYLLTPYDYGVISLYYLLDRIQGNIDQETFVLNDLLQTELAKQVIVEDPRYSSPGLGFLLETIAIYGDEAAGIDGIVDGNWETFWANISQNVRITPSWGAAFDLLYVEEANRPMMVSYTSSPAFGECLDGATDAAALLSNEAGKNNWGWQQIEGLGLAKNSPHEDLAKDFIDWFISDEVQSQIYLNQWIYPAKTNIIAPDCFDVVTPLDQINSLNSYISQEKLAIYLDDWLNKWESVVIFA